jgi:hypothetical protein
MFEGLKLGALSLVLSALLTAAIFLLIFPQKSGQG